MGLATGARLGGFEVLGPLGSGGMGEVYRARDTRLGREVALKVLPESLASDRDRLSRFEQEARAASALNHPNIVTIHEIGREGDATFIAMELVDGKTLRELTVSGPMPVKKVLNVAAQVSEGLAKAHGAGIVHRDLKPENVMVSKDGFVKILDFGLAKLIETDSGEVSAMPTVAQPETRPGTVMGTVGYMSPEQASGEPLDYRSDQFSLGSMVYEMLTGKKAFQRKTAAETMSAIIREEPEPAGKLRPDVPLPVRWILERCMAKDPEDRYAATRDLARDLAGLRDHISEASSGAEAMFASPVRSGRRALSAVAGGALLVVAGLASGWALTRALSRTPPSAPSFQRLTFRQGRIGNARFTPDGQAILYGAHWEGDASNMQLYQTRPESPESGRFDFPNGDMLAISKSGELAILLDETPAGGTLARAPMTGGIARRVLEGVQYAGADWSPDGRELAIVREVEGESRLEYPIGKPLLKSRQDFFASPRFSPDGERIAFFESLSQPSVGVIDTRGSAKKILSGGWASLSGAPCWTPNGKEIWVTGATAPGQPEALWAVSLSGKRRLVTRVPGVLELDDISRQGRVLMAHHTMLRTLRGRANDGGSERDLSWLDWSNPSDLSNDGKLLLLTERGEGSGATPAVYLRGTDGSPALRIGEGFGLALSPDGKWVLALRRVRGEPATLVLLPTGPGETKTLKNEGLQEYGGGAWLPDGKRIIFSAKTAGGRDRLYLQDVAGGAPRPIGSDGLTIRRFASPLSPDGKSVVGLRGAETVVIRLDGGEPRPVAGIAAGEIPTQWSADGRSLYVYGWVSGGQIMKVSMVDLESGQRTFFTEIKLEGGVRARWLRITPDGKSYAYAGNRGLSELYLVDGLR